MQPTSDGTDRQIEDLGDFLVRKSFHFPENNHRLVLFFQTIDRTSQDFGHFLGPDLLQRGVGLAERLFSAVVPNATQGNLGLPFPPYSQGDIERDPVQPGIKTARLPKRRKSQESLQKSLLHDILGVFGVPDDPDHRIEKAVLIVENQFPIRGPVSGQAFLNQFVVVHKNVPTMCWRTKPSRWFRKNTVSRKKQRKHAGYLSSAVYRNSVFFNVRAN